MKRIDIYYGGDHYSVGGRQLEELQQEIESGLSSGAYWLEANDGEGSERQAFLLVTPGVPITVVPIPDESSEIATDVWRPEDAYET
jgi:protein involved in polysaccharide export with SLBB domain